MGFWLFLRRVFGKERVPSSECNRRRHTRNPCRHFASTLELLEDRITPTGNIVLTGVALVDGSNQALTSVNMGEQVDVRADFTTQGLPSNASYRVIFDVNGYVLSTGTLTAGAGGSGTGSWEYYWGTFQASLGTNQVAVTVDPDQSVAETSYTDNTKSLTFSAAAPQVAGSTMSYTVAQIRDAYGLNNVPSFGSGAADGTGQTIAIDDANNDPSLFSAIDSFDQLYSLTEGSSETVYQQYGAASSFITVYNQNGVNITANIANSGTGTAPNEVPALGDAGSVGEEVGDVAWAHAIAPGARIDLIETDSYGSIITGDGAAASLPDVSVVSNSWALTEWSGETADDSSTYVTPSGHTGVTFLTSSGDNGANAYGADGTTVGTDGYYSAASPNVVSVGGTQLTVNNDAYGGETGWSYPTPSSTIVNGSSSYSQTGSWTSHPGGFSGTYSTAAGGGSGSGRSRLRRLTRVGGPGLRCRQPGPPARQTRPTRPTRFMTGPSRPGPFWAR
jgi:subtilase family serine protease